MQNVVILLACLYAEVLANIECLPPEKQKSPSYFADPKDCSSYYKCDNGVPVHVTCPGDLVWNQVHKTCDFKWRTPCSTPEFPPSTEAFSHDEELPTSLPSDPIYDQCNVRFFPDKTDSRKYYECVNGTLISSTCPDGLKWDAVENMCDFSWDFPPHPMQKSLPTPVEFHEREFVCPPPTRDGNCSATYHPDYTNCHKYFECDNGVLKALSCPHGLVWSQNLLSCDHQWNTPCTTERMHHNAPAVSTTSSADGKETVSHHFIHKF